MTFARLAPRENQEVVSWSGRAARIPRVIVYRPGRLGRGNVREDTRTKLTYLLIILPDKGYIRIADRTEKEFPFGFAYCAIRPIELPRRATK